MSSLAQVQYILVMMIMLAQPGMYCTMTASSQGVPEINDKTHIMLLPTCFETMPYIPLFDLVQQIEAVALQTQQNWNKPHHHPQTAIGSHWHKTPHCLPNW
jgi:hypothetical protein